MKSLYAFLIGCCLLCCTSLYAQPQLQTRDVITGLTVPWEILWGPDGWIWMTERGGRISRVNPETGEQKVLITISDVTQATESGLLGMTLHPNFADTPSVFVVYTYGGTSSLREKLVRYTYNGTTLVNPTTLVQDIPASSTHDGSRLVILPDHTLLMTTGDAQNSAGAQSHTVINGKILRMNLDGTAPADNPYAGAPYPANLIWTTGHRNPQGLTYAPTGYVYSSEHGPSSNDEINIIRRGRNYGWPNVQGFCNDGGSTEAKFCTDSNVVEPLIAWTPTIAPAGIEYYNNDAIPEWKNSLLLTTLNGNGSDLRQLTLNDSANRIISETIFFDGTFGRLRDICIAPDGRVFISTSNKDGRGAPKTGDDRIIEIRAMSDATIITGEISPTTLNAGQDISVPFTVNGTFTVGNVFTAQLSAANGSFAAPQTIGMVTGTEGGTIDGKVPCDAGGSQFRIRVVSNSPTVVGSDNGTDLIIGNAPTINLGPDISTCQGDEVHLSAASSNVTVFRWAPSTGLSCTDCSNPVARPSATTTYVLEGINGFGCTVKDSLTITVLPSPQPVITTDGTTLTSSAAATYQWQRDGAPIGGATEQIYMATASGWYRVIVTDANGCVGQSDSVQVVIAGVPPNTDNDMALQLYPDPAKSELTVELNQAVAGSMEWRVIDLTGKTVVQLTAPSGGGRVSRHIDVSQLPSGTYLLEVRNGDKLLRRKFVRQ